MFGKSGAEWINSVLHLVDFLLRRFMQKPFSRTWPLTLLLVCVLLNTLPAQISKWEIGGYAKDLLTYTDGFIEGLPLSIGQWQNTFQLRLNTAWYPARELTVAAQARNLFTYQKSIKILRTFQDLVSNDSYYFNLKWTWLEENDMDGFSEIDRLYLDWYLGDIELTAGRQRISWGTCLVWNPTDLFNPFDILDFDYEERPGTDAVQVQYYTGSLSQFNLAFTPGRESNDVIYAGRYTTNHWNYDFAIIAGWQRNSLRLAFNWAGQLADGGFRGEILYSDPKLKYTSIDLFSLTWQQIHLTRPYLTAALSYDYTFSNSLYIHTEYLYNGLGTTDKAGSRRFDIIYTGELTPARQSIFQEFAYQISPLLRADIFFILNPNDLSWIAAPSLQYSLATNWEIYLLAFPTGGDKGTEYGGYPAQYFARLKWSF
jgi:hypothetical protein